MKRSIKCIFRIKNKIRVFGVFLGDNVGGHHDGSGVQPSGRGDA